LGKQKVTLKKLDTLKKAGIFNQRVFVSDNSNLSHSKNKLPHPAFLKEGMDVS